MIDFFKDYVLTLCVVAAVSGVLTLLAPNDTYEKPIKLIVSLFILICLVGPFVKGDAFKNIKKFNFNEKKINIYSSGNNVWNESATIIKNTLRSKINDIVFEKSKRNADNIDIVLIKENDSFKVSSVTIDIPNEKVKVKDSIIGEIQNKLGINKNVIFFRQEEYDEK